MNNGDDRRSDEIELLTILKIKQKLEVSDINNVDAKSQIDHQTQIQETKDSGWIFDNNNSMRIEF